MTECVVTDELRFNPETGLYRREDGIEFELVHDAERDLWVSADGAEYVQNINRINDPVYLRVDGDVWRLRILGKAYLLNWSAVDLPYWLKSELKGIQVQRLRSVVPSDISKLRNLCSAMRDIEPELFDGRASVGDWTSAELVKILLKVNEVSRDYASVFRMLYADLVTSGLAGCTHEKLEILEQYRLSGKTALPHVRSWDPGTGALTTAELETLRRNLLPPKHSETDTEHFARVFLRTLVALGRRPSQLLGVATNGIARPKQDDRLPAVIWIPGAKAQRNDRHRPYDLPDDLFDDLMRFSHRPKIQEAQGHFGFFFVTPITTQTRIAGAGQRDAGNTSERLHDWISRVGIISPRTGKSLHVTPTRLRHTVATQLVRKGWSKADIQEFLEHQSDNSVIAYIDAVGSDLTPALERADRALGGLFNEITNIFQGKVVPRPIGKVEKPIVVPDTKNRAIIGQCGLAGLCPKSPFSACVSGCAHFLFFKDADVAAARAYIHGEHERWRVAEGNAQRARAHDDFARMDAGLLEAQKAVGLTDEQ